MPKKVSISKAQSELDFENSLPVGMETFTVRFLATWFRTSDQHWINLVESGHLRAVDLRTPGKSKSLIRIPRSVLVDYLNSKSS